MNRKDASLSLLSEVQQNIENTVQKGIFLENCSILYDDDGGGLHIRCHYVQIIYIYICAQNTL